MRSAVRRATRSSALRAYRCHFGDAWFSRCWPRESRRCWGLQVAQPTIAQLDYKLGLQKRIGARPKAGADRRRRGG